MRSSVEDLLIAIGGKLRHRRELLGLHQSQLSALSGVSVRTIQLVEQGKGNPSLHTLLLLAEPLGLQLEFLLRDPAKNSKR